ncbi:unnamed protein product [Paramecium pentaurelia]|uniref:Uncharacterized protein n=1 Tax=Paramecium pentaurelia TaxID=43138 RepID=A0A8S1S4P2_9CILI|nr:unnamed protein product [Paramecium pentaurelia]
MPKYFTLQTSKILQVLQKVLKLSGMSFSTKKIKNTIQQRHVSLYSSLFLSAYHLNNIDEYYLYTNWKELFKRACRSNKKFLQKKINMSLNQKNLQIQFQYSYLLAQSFFSDLVALQNEMFRSKQFRERSDRNKKVIVVSITDLFLFDKVAFMKTFSQNGFQKQPKRFENPKICLLNQGLKLKSQKRMIKEELINLKSITRMSIIQENELCYPSQKVD